MKHLLSVKRLNQAGIHHILMPVLVFILLFGIGGSYFLLKSDAAPWSGALEVGSTSSGYCMDIKGGSYTGYTPVVLNKCNGKVNQKWELQNAGTFNGHAAYTIATFAAGKFMCVDNWGQSSANGNVLRLYKCNGVDPAERFVWTWVNGNVHNLYNPERARCIDDQGGATSPNNTLDLYTCKTSGSGNWNQMWFESGNTASASSAPVVTSTSTSTTSSSSSTSAAVPKTAATGIALQVGVDRKLCMENMNNSNVANTTVLLGACSNTASESWTLQQVANNRFLLKAKTSGACVLDPSGAVGTNAGNRVYLYTTACNTGDKNQTWMWAGNGNHELKNASAAGGCINDPANSTTAGTSSRLIAYSCAANSSNEQWFEAAL